MRDDQLLTKTLITRLNQQPIALAELNHQTRSAPRRKRRWTRWLDNGFNLIVYGTAVLLLLSEIVKALGLSRGIWGLDYTTDPPNWFRVGVITCIVLSIAAAVVMHFRWMFQTLALSANSITRERQSNNWDMLILTGIDAGKIVQGKWWATVRRMTRPYMMLGILRALLVVWAGALNGNLYIYQIYGRTGFLLIQVIVAGAGVFILTMANLFFTAACGVSAFNKRSGLALARAIGTRLILIVALTGLALLILRLFTRYDSPTVIPSIVAFGLLSLFDNGAALGSQLATYRYGGYSAYGVSLSIDPVVAIYLPAAFLTLLLYALLTFLMLRFAQWQVVRGGATPPLTPKPVKTD
ncbi:MAG: hypothetical protein ABI690_26090 [Chloroflexota bacterium]